MQQQAAHDAKLNPMAAPLPDPPTSPHSGLTSTVAIAPLIRSRSPTSPIIHLAVLSSVIVLPYLLVRRQLVSLRRTVSEMGMANSMMRRDMKVMHSEVSVRQHEHQTVLQLVRATKDSLDELKRLTEQRDAALKQVEDRLEREMKDTKQKLETLEVDVVERDRARQDAEKAHHAELKALLYENQWSKAHLSALKDLGTSLADVAAFMQEVELKEGYTTRKDDGRGIERIRQLALKLNSLMSPKVEKAQPAKATKKASDSTSGSDKLIV